MAGEAPIITVAQAEGGDALQQGVVVTDPATEAGVAEGTYAAGETEAAAFPPFESSTFAGQLIWLALSFAILYFALSRIALPRIGGIIDARRSRIEGDLREAERLRLETEKAVAAYEAALAAARSDAGKIAEDTRQSIRADIDGKRLSTEASLATRMTEADSRIQASKAAALQSVDSIAAETAQALLAQLGTSVSEADAKNAVAEAKGA